MKGSVRAASAIADERYSWLGGGCTLFLRRSPKKMAEPMMSAPPMPPTTPPTMAPVFE